ncbi:hypothetical protein CHELA40_15340 [Chelatococcus asaccharovorans]|nr:hypothetical protein CHELA17_60277 [Chelatococcus asaccharovorans]CAH1682222.1 hypothetical protein CHELA40_15340 [Chelatococcus asaccharovorans]
MVLLSPSILRAEGNRVGTAAIATLRGRSSPPTPYPSPQGGGDRLAALSIFQPLCAGREMAVLEDSGFGRWPRRFRAPPPCGEG